VYFRRGNGIVDIDWWIVGRTRKDSEVSRSEKVSSGPGCTRLCVVSEKVLTLLKLCVAPLPPVVSHSASRRNKILMQDIDCRVNSMDRNVN